MANSIIEKKLKLQDDFHSNINLKFNELDFSKSSVSPNWNGFYVKGKGEKYLSWFEYSLDSNTLNSSLRIGTRTFETDNSTTKSEQDLTLKANKDGTHSISVKYPEDWRTALNCVNKAGDTMTGALNFANGVWNKMGDDCYIGDHNIGGVICLKSTQGANQTGIAFYNPDQSAYGTIRWTGTNFTISHKTTFSGIIETASDQMTDSFTNGGINLRNSNIIGVNSIYTSDASESANEGIHFYRDATHVDTLWMQSGTLLFSPNRAIGTGTTLANSQKVARFTVNPTDGQIPITDGVYGGMKSISYDTLKSNMGIGAVVISNQYTSILDAINAVRTTRPFPITIQKYTNASYSDSPASSNNEWNLLLIGNSNRWTAICNPFSTGTNGSIFFRQGFNGNYIYEWTKLQNAT